MENTGEIIALIKGLGGGSSGGLIVNISSHSGSLVSDKSSAEIWAAVAAGQTVLAQKGGLYLPFFGFPTIDASTTPATVLFYQLSVTGTAVTENSVTVNAT